MVRKSKLISDSKSAKGNRNLDILEMSKKHHVFIGLKVAHLLM
jgi:hypothetical protein